MSNAKNIYDQIIDLNYINAHMIGNPFEDTWFDCKQKNNASHGKMDEKDKSNFAKALSGFANSSGGVLIFGLDARKIDGIDQIQSLEPIKDLKLFESELKEAESRVVERAISGLLYQKIYTDENNDKGLIKIYIPEGNNPPYRSIVDKGFYIRAGGNFVPIDLPQIEGLVLKQIKPDLDLEINITRGQMIANAQTDIALNFRVSNIGRSTAKYALLQLRFEEKEFIVFKINNGRVNPYIVWRDQYSGDFVYSFHYEKAIHPNQWVPSSEFPLIYPAINNPLTAPPLCFIVSLFAENMPQKIYSVSLGSNFWFGLRGRNDVPLIKQGQNFIM